MRDGAGRVAAPPRPMRRRVWHGLRCAIACCVVLVCSAASARAPSDAFDCEDAFDVIAMSVMLRCAAWRAPESAAARIEAVRRRLIETRLARPEEFADLHIAFCPLLRGTAVLPDPAHLYLDDGLLTMSRDGLAEIVAHELQHRVQFTSFGPRGFKCAYVRAMLACGGCQDRRHPLEAEAYARQDRVRTGLGAAPAGDGEP